MNLSLKAIMAIVFGMTCWVHAQNGPSATTPKRLLITYGDYQRPPVFLIQTLINTGEPNKPELEQLQLGIGLHGDTVDIWKARLTGWITGTGKVADALPLAPGQKWAASFPGNAVRFEGRKADLVVVQLDLRYAKNKNGQEKIRSEIEKAIVDYVAAAKSVGARLVFYVTPGKQHMTYREGSQANAIRLIEADYQPELQAMETECRRLSATFGAIMAPTFRAFAILRATHPEIDLHEPIWHGDNGHLSPRDQVLTALVISRAFLGEGEHPLPTPEVLLAPLNEQITNGNRKHPSKDGPRLAAIDTATWKAMLEATAAAFTAPTNQK